MFNRLRRRFRALARRSDVERDLDDELYFHLEQEIDKNRRLGMNAADARRQALVAFGGVERTKEAHRDGRGVRFLEDLGADIRYALRALRRNPILAVTAVGTLTLGIGANTAIFSAVNAVIIRPLPYPAPDRLVMLWEENPEKGWYKETAAPANFLDWHEQVTSFESSAAYTDFNSRRTLTGHGEPTLLLSSNVTGDFFTVLGVPPALGRTMRPEETWTTSSRVAVISHRAWRDLFASDPNAVGRTAALDGEDYQIIGVMPPGFAYPSPETDLWTSMGWDPARRDVVGFRRAHYLRVVARLKPGVTREHADAEFQTLVTRLKTQYPATNIHMGAGMTPLHEFIVGDTRRPLFVMLGAAGLLLLIACANVGNLVLVQALGREREVAVRLALGAGRARLARQAITESVVLSAIGGACGLALGWAGTRGLMAMQPRGMLPVREATLDARVFMYVFGLALVSGLAFGVIPAMWVGARAPADAIKEGGRGGGRTRRAGRLGDLLVVGEVSLALLLTIGSGLLLTSFWRLRQVEPGFDPHGVLAVTLNASGKKYEADGGTSFFEQAVARMQALPGVDGAAAATDAPLSGGGYTSDFSVAGWPPDKHGFEAAHRSITPDYFAVMRVPIRHGRAFTPADRLKAANVVIINQALADKYFRDEDPIDKRVAFDKKPDSSSVWFTIVGVAGSEHQTTLARDPKIEFLTPAPQDPSTLMTVFMRTKGDPVVLGPAARRVIADLDPSLAIRSIRPMTQVYEESMARERFLATLLLVFAGVGLALAIVGVFGVMAQLVQRRTREMGIRLALGAQATQVRWLVVRHGLALMVAGVTIGVVAATLVTKTMVDLLYRTAPLDPIAFVAVPAILAATGLAASWLPALRASRADPSRALRAD